MSKEEKTEIDPFEKMRSLQILTVQITRFYSFIFDRLKRSFPRSRLNCWVDAFCMSSELEMKGDLSLRDAISEIMRNEADIDLVEWNELQGIRKLRNRLCHPASSAAAAEDALTHFKEHPAYSALRKMLDVTKKLGSTGLTPQRTRTPIKKMKRNWRSRDCSNENKKIDVEK